nr:MATE family efflux transporter [Kitasatospora sp. SID7827]
MVLVSAVAFTGDLCGAVLRATGATGRAALLTLVWVCLSIGGVAGLGNLGGLGLAALIWSLAVAALAQAGLGLALLHRRGLLTRHSAGRLRSGIGPLAVRVALPVGGSYLLLFAVNLAQLAVLAPYGPETVAGFTLGYTLQGVVIVPALAFGSAVAVLVNRHASAGREDLARGALRRGTELAVAGYGALAVLLWAAGDRLALLTGDPRTAAETARFMGEVGPTFSCTALTLVVFAVLEQTGRGPVTVVLNAVYFAVVLGLGAWLTARWHDPLGLYRVLAVGAVLGMLSGGGIGLRVLRRRVVSAALVGASGGPDAATGPVAAAGGPG